MSSHKGNGDRGSVTSVTTFSKPTPLYTLPRSPEKPLAQCQVKPMLKTPLNNHYLKTDDDECSKTPVDFVPISLDKPTGLSIDDFLPVRNLFTSFC